MRVQHSPRVCVFLLHHGVPSNTKHLPLYLRRVFNDVLPFPKAVRGYCATVAAKVRIARLQAQVQQVATDLAQHPEAVRAALEILLRTRGYDARVLLANLYSAPHTRDALLEARAHAAHAAWLVLPLFPQYAFDTTRRCTTELYARLSPSERERTLIIDGFATHPGVLDAMASNINAVLATLPKDVRREVHMVFAGRGIPMRAVNQGDPYPRQVEQTVTGLLARIGSPPRHTLAFHHRGLHMAPKTRWSRRLEPSLRDSLQHLGAAGQRNVLVVPLSAAMEDFDTLHGLDITMRSDALAAGIRGFYRVPAASTQPGFVDALASMVQEQVPTALPRDEHPVMDLATVAEEAEHHQEHVDEVQIKLQGAAQR